jgi:phosphoenolpyruvate phosphomutase
VFAFCDQYNALPRRRPLVAVPSSYSSVTEEELSERGVNVVIYANQLLRSAYPAMVRTAKVILQQHRSAECDADLLPIKDILELIPITGVGGRIPSRAVTPGAEAVLAPAVVETLQ